MKIIRRHQKYLMASFVVHEKELSAGFGNNVTKDNPVGHLRCVITVDIKRLSVIGERF